MEAPMVSDSPPTSIAKKIVNPFCILFCILLPVKQIFLYCDRAGDGAAVAPRDSNSHRRLAPMPCGAVVGAHRCGYRNDTPVLLRSHRRGVAEVAVGGVVAEYLKRRVADTCGFLYGVDSASVCPQTRVEPRKPRVVRERIAVAHVVYVLHRVLRQIKGGHLIARNRGAQKTARRDRERTSYGCCQ